MCTRLYNTGQYYNFVSLYFMVKVQGSLCVRDNVRLAAENGVSGQSTSISSAHQGVQITVCLVTGDQNMVLCGQFF